jgi:hypothetical protein
MDMCHDVRPKVRKAAYGCLVEICMVSFQTAADTTMDEEAPAAAMRMKQSLQSQRCTLSNKIYAHVHSFVLKQKKDAVKIVHMLRFLEHVIPYSSIENAISFGQVCLSLLDIPSLSVEIVRQSLSTLLSILELSSSSSSDEYSEINKFACHCCAFLLSHRPTDQGVVNLYGRCFIGCILGHMVNTNTNAESNATADTVQSKLLAFKLLPNVLKSLLHLCRGEEESCCAEWNQLLSGVIPILLRCAYDNNDDDDANDEQQPSLTRVSLEIIPQCVTVVKEALQIQYRHVWGSILSGGYASFTIGLASKLSECGNNHDNKLQSYVKSLVLSLLQLRQDVEKDGVARTSVEYCTSVILRGMGLESFMTLVDFVNDDVSNTTTTTTASLQSSSTTTTTGGGIRDDRAWLLPLMKQSAPLFASESAVTMMFTETTMKTTHLSFFQGRVLSLARRCDAASADGHRTVVEVSIQKVRVVELWALFPAFCLCPVDMKDNFAALAKTVVKALGDYTRYPKLIVSESFFLAAQA